MRLLALSLVTLRAFRFSQSGRQSYLDPGTGSMMIQVLLGGVAGVAVLAKVFWHRLSGVFRMGAKQSVKAPPTDE